MSYDPIRDAGEFRRALRRLADVEHLTSQSIVDLFNRQRARGDKLSISRATLDRFVQGEDITKIRELRAIHDILRTHPAYGAYFAPEEASCPDRLVREMGMFLLPNGAAPSEDVMVGLPGQFVLMRRDHDSVGVENGVRVSSLFLDAEAGGMAIRETQSYRTTDYDMPFDQLDRGWLFSHGPLLYFLMKEVGGTCVKFGVIEQLLPELDRRQPVQYFQGHLMAVSRRGVFPRTRFAARRFSPNQHPMTSGILRLSEIADARAVEHLRRDYVEGAAAQPA